MAHEEASILIGAVAAYRLMADKRVELMSEQKALSRRIKEIEDELPKIEIAEEDARRALLRAARGAYNGASQEVEAEPNIEPFPSRRGERAS